METAKPSTIPTLTSDERLRISRAISDPTRFDIFRQIASSDCVAWTNLREQVSITAPTVSHHLRELENAGLIHTVREGKFVSLRFRREVWQAYLNDLAAIG